MRTDLFTWPIDREVTKGIFAYILFAILIISFFILIYYNDKIFKKIEPYMEKYTYLLCGFGCPIFIFILLSLMKFIAYSYEKNFVNQLYLVGITFFLWASFVCVCKLMKNFGEYVSQKKSFPQIIFYILSSLFSVVLCFGFTYNALYYYDNSMFSFVVNDGIFGEALQFVYYSFEIMFNTEVSDIKAENYWSQGINILESLTSFLVIVILIANYENIGKMFKEDNKLPMDSNVQENKETDN